MTRVTITLQTAAGETDSFLIESATEGIDFSDLVRQAEARWTPGDGETVKIEGIEEDGDGYRGVIRTAAAPRVAVPRAEIARANLVFDWNGGG